MKAPRIVAMFVLTMVALCLGCADDHESPLQPTPVSTAKVELLNPNGGSFFATKIIDIRWAASPEIVSFRLYSSSNRGGYWRDITYGRYIPFISWQWDVGMSRDDRVVLDTPDYLIKVVGYDGSGNAVAEDVSDPPFMLYYSNPVK